VIASNRPDRTTSRAAVEGKTHGDHAENQRQSREHGRPAPRPLSFGLELGIFKHRGARVHCHQMRARIPTLTRAGPGTTILCNKSHKPGNSISSKPGAFLATCSRRGCRIWGCPSAVSNAPRRRARLPTGSPAAMLRMAFSEHLCRHGGVVCGQALMALADTAMVIAILAANRGYRPMTTVDQTTHFMRAVTSADVLADARVVRLGRTMSFGRVTLSSATDNKPVAIVSSAFAML
jgi:uncharacterized protein (TIGR00369 family)